MYDFVPRGDGARSVAIGYVADGVFYKQILPRHLLRVPPAICVDTAVLDALRARGVERLVVLVNDGRRYEAAVDDFDRRGFAVDRGFGKQRGLPLNAWRQP